MLMHAKQLHLPNIDVTECAYIYMKNSILKTF